MKFWRPALIALLSFALTSAVAHASPSPARHKVGPATLRGVVAHLHTHDFQLKTATKGDYQVTLRAATSVTRKGGGSIALRAGDHVGVRGFVHGRQIVAITIRIYPVKPKPRTLTGTVVAVKGSQLLVSTAGHTSSARITANTVIDVGTQQGTVSALHSGDHVRMRVQPSDQGMLALTIHVFRTTPAGRRIQVRGTVVSSAGSGLTISSGTSVYRIQVTHQTRLYVGNRQGSSRALSRGVAVTVFACCAGGPMSATSIHIQSVHASSTHLQERGTIVSVKSGRITLRSGSHAYIIALTSATRIYVGSRAGSPGDVRTGGEATIFACCTGRPLVATSIHLRVVHAAHVSVLIHGRVLSTSGSHLRLSAANGAVDVTLLASTLYDRASSTAGKSDLHPGDQVSVRAVRAGPILQAQRVHIYVSRVRLQSIRGTVVSVTATAMTVRANGQVYSVSVSPSVPVMLNRVPARLAAVRSGDLVHVTGRPAGRGRMSASRIGASRPPVKVQTVRGSLLQIQGGMLVIVDDLGTRRYIRLASNVRPTLQGQPAPPAAIFPGVRVEVHGSLTGTTLLATAVSITVKSRKIDGRVRSVTRSSLRVAHGTQQESEVVVPPGVAVTDGGKHLSMSALHVGTYVHVEGYEEGNSAVRAASVRVLHPSVDISGTIVMNGSQLTVRSSTGDEYRIHTSSATTISSGRVQVTLGPTDLTSGAHVRVQGTVRTDGLVAAEQIDVRLVHAVLRGQVGAISPTILTLTIGATSTKVRLQDGTTFVQGSHDITAADVVVGDDVSADGYRVGPTAIIARKVTVHRRLEALDGTVTLVDSDGFTLATLSGSMRVVTSDSTVYTGAASGNVSIGVRVHVSGYLRGDGVLLATHVRVEAKKSP